MLIKRNGQVTHATAAFSDPFAFGGGQGAFNGVVGDIAVGHPSVEEDKEVAEAIVLQMSQANTKLI